MKVYVKKSMCSFKSPKNKVDRAIAKFMEYDVISVSPGPYRCQALNLKGENLEWWSENKYYAYGRHLKFNSPGLVENYGDTMPSDHFKNILANIEHGNLTLDLKGKVSAYECNEHKSEIIYLIKGEFVCMKCGFDKPKKIYDLTLKEYMK